MNDDLEQAVEREVELQEQAAKREDRLRELGFIRVVDKGPPHNCRNDLYDQIHYRAKIAMDVGSVWRCPKCGSLWRKGHVVFDGFMLAFWHLTWYRLRWYHRKRGVV